MDNRFEVITTQDIEYGDKCRTAEGGWIFERHLHTVVLRDKQTGVMYL